jgi:quinoprotein dehydrogenase-associated probable ABC transporter substrate-binding protein
MLTLSLPATAAEAQAQQVLRVCADPNNLPLSNRKQEGYENKIAQLLADELGWKLEYTWFPQRLGFIRNTLRARLDEEDRFKCDLVIGVPVGFELAATTKPYLRSTWALAYVKGKGLDGVRTPEDLLKLEPARLKALRFGAFAQTPPVDWLLKHELLDQLVPYQRMSGDPEEYPGEMIEKDLAAGKIDVGFAWGPIAGYFVQRAPAAGLVAVPFKPDPDIKFDYSIAMGVRFGEREWRSRIDQLVEKNRDRIRAILAGYGVPQLDDAGELIPVAAPLSGQAR